MRVASVFLLLVCLGCEADLEKSCPHIDFFVAPISQEEERKIWEEAHSKSSCIHEGVRGRLSNCPRPHDCIGARPDTMPSISSTTLLPDIIVEFDRKGQLLNLWTTPAEPRLYAVEGNVIFVRQDSFAEDAWRYIKIHTDGSYDLVRRPISVFRSETKCPSDVSMFNRPNAIECWVYIDLASNRDRVFATPKPTQCRRIGPNVNKDYFSVTTNDPLELTC